MRKYLVYTFAIWVLISCTDIKTSDPKPYFKIDGSSTVHPIVNLAKSKYEKVDDDHKNVINLSVSGTGGGFQALCEGKAEVANASRKITKSERRQCERNGVSILKIPIAMDGIAIVVHPGNNWVDYLSVNELRRLWQPIAERSLSKWSELRKGWPDRTIRIYGPGSASGTYDYFTRSILPDQQATRGDYMATEDDNFLVKGVANDSNSLGVFGLGYYQENFYQLKLVPIKNNTASKDISPVMPSLETVKNGTYQPLSRSLYIYVAQKAVLNPELREFIYFFLDNAPEIVREIGYVPQPSTFYSEAKEQLRMVTVSADSN
ncbi:PstS family phosphate ABC transporter substrate-binding protein [Fodinibius halophilus]|uniref:Phosphate-binding protein n=1 Tax=Fodinibius halophilus TaxID=1736908 RepID=A0A6M1TCD8_9BACT|nr:PstS family phosphate ABC transporter substrate-binding protein [Fodinibius halophilus]NGP89661.1 PstS family phosphate ABC transporter substrate-binding protein [Fodinibius halophilus]